MVEIKHLKKGDILVKEGDLSNSMYWVQSGTLRLFKKKGQGFIELGVVHSGEVVGEMSFLDNQPRSASVEGLQPCDIVEIPRGKFDEFIAAQPSWMKSLIQTLVKRLRTTNNRVRELESASMVYTKDDQGRTTKSHEFLSSAESMKLCSGLLLAAARNGEKAADGTLKVKAGWLQFYGGQIFGVQLSKVQAFTDVLHEVGAIRIEKQKDFVELMILDMERLEKYIYFSHEQNSLPDDKQIQVTAKGVAILECINAFGNLPAGAETATVDLEAIFKAAAEKRNQKIPFEWGSFDELVKSGFAAEIRLNGQEKSSVIQVGRFQKLFPLLFLRQKFRDLNSQKRDG
ncbi:MAG: Crp/Fnr family transcriptional regulator [Bdellovibrionota bacterium]